MDITASYGVLVGRTLVDASEWSASVLNRAPMLWCCLPSHVLVIWYLCLRSWWLVLQWSLRGLVGRSRSTWKTLLRALILPWEWRAGYTQRYPTSICSCVSCSGGPVTGHTTAVQHDIETNDARPVRCGPRYLARAGLRTEHTCIKEMLEGVRSSPVIVHGLLSWY